MKTFAINSGTWLAATWFARVASCASLLAVVGCGPGRSAAAATTPDVGVAVVELFTSEGCSSCPPAEQSLADIADDAEKKGRPIFPLAFHVDYWNNLGWADPFSSPQFSARQGFYSHVFGLDEVYTPQMIVNGHTQLNGSDRDAAAKAIGDALAKPATALVMINIVRNDNGGCRLHYSITHGEANATVNVAVVERGLSSDVKRGENAGRQLQDPCVVRWFSSGTLNQTGIADVDIPALPAVHLDHASVIVYLQRASDSTVLGAAAIPCTVKS